MDSESSVIRSAKSFFAGTLLSRVLGMARDISMAFCFGSAPEVAAFMVAYRLANLFRRLFGEGNLQAGFIPHFEKLRLEGSEEAACFYRDFFYSLLLLVLGLVSLGALFLSLFYLIVPSDIVLMSLAMLPGVAFVCFYALEMSVLQCWKSYFLPSFAPVFFNLFWIASAFFLKGLSYREAMFGLSFCLVGGFFFQWASLMWAVRRKMAPLLNANKRRLEPFSSQVRALFKPMAFGLIGVGAAQFNSALDAIFARSADLSGPAYLWYAIRIQQLPLALFGIALSGALLPPLSRAFQSGQMDRFTALLQSGLKKGGALMIPCAVGMLVLGVPGLDLLYGRGHFLFEDVVKTNRCLIGYALGLIPMAFTLFLANAFYAKKQYAWPARCSLASVACNLFLNALFTFGLGWGAEGVAWATTLSAFFNCALLSKRMGGFIPNVIQESVLAPPKIRFLNHVRYIWGNQGAILFCAILSALISWPFTQLFLEERHFIAQLFRFGSSATIYLAVLFASAYWMGAKEIFEVLGLKKRAPLSEDSEA